ncbi:bifunctional helix-turn-helix transcriptional regulator/GNAT family N-acetyltransferase [Paracoccus aminophilus]|nr:bifunctional helix-turn-helix transcriptional regulator/GNAT family N-acetyltransferase [Paracoccus aminophilus]
MIDAVREASRHLVRELGFMGGDFAGTDLSPSAVHALIEIERKAITARDLASLLRLEKSSVSRMLRKLVEAGYVAETAGAEDGRTKRLSLTPQGEEQVSKIHAFARAQVSEALARLQPDAGRTVLEGLSLYSSALKGSPARGDEADPFEILPGYQTGVIASITQMHAQYYARTSGFGRVFETVVAGGLAEFVSRLDHPRNALWTVRKNDQICGSIAIDGEDMGGDTAHLRWFIVDDAIRGAGIGGRLLATALAFVDAQGFKETQLWTFSGLSAARHLYEAHGFLLVEERAGSQWGTEVTEQRFARPARSPE